MKKVLTLCMALIAVLFSTQAAFASYPKPTGYVNDFANVLSSSFKASEEKKLSDYTKKTTNEIAVVTVNTTGDTAIEDYSIGLAQQWKPGVSGKDNGIIILFAMQDHHDRIEIGCGLEGSFTDIQAQSILDNDTRTLMRQGQVDQAVGTTVDQVIAQLGNATPQPCKVGSQQAINDARATTANGGNSNSDTNSGNIPGWLVALFVVLAILIVLGIIVAVSSDDGDDDGSGGFGSGFGLGTLAGGIANAIGGDDDSGSSSDSGGFGGFSGGSFSGGGASGGW